VAGLRLEIRTLLDETILNFIDIKNKSRVAGLRLFLVESKPGEDRDDIKNKSRVAGLRQLLIQIGTVS
jgi:hypothetical protein